MEFTLLDSILVGVFPFPLSIRGGDFPVSLLLDLGGDPLHSGSGLRPVSGSIFGQYSPPRSECGSFGLEERGEVRSYGSLRLLPDYFRKRELFQ